MSGFLYLGNVGKITEQYYVIAEVVISRIDAA